MYTLLRKQLRLQVLERELQELNSNRAYYIQKLEEILQPVYQEQAEELRQNIGQEFDKLVQETEQRVLKLREEVGEK